MHAGAVRGSFWCENACFRPFCRFYHLFGSGLKCNTPFHTSPLSGAAKQLARMDQRDIYVGGGTQLMFGIWGSRWVGRPDVKAIANEFWVHPSKSEVPSNAEKLEGAAYF